MNPSGRRNMLGEISSIAAALRDGAGADGSAGPDFTREILSRVDSQRPFLNGRARRAVWIGRFGLGASVAMVVLATCLAFRFAPGTVDLSQRPTPLSSVVESVGTHADMRLTSLRRTIDSVGRSEPAALISNVAFRGEPVGRGAEDLSAEPVMVAAGPTIPAFEAAVRGVGVRPVRATVRTADRLGYKLPASSLRSTMQQASLRSTVLRDEMPVRAGALINERDLDAGLGPK